MPPLRTGCFCVAEACANSSYDVALGKSSTPDDLELQTGHFLVKDIKSPLSDLISLTKANVKEPAYYDFILQLPEGLSSTTCVKKQSPKQLPANTVEGILDATVNP